MLVLTRRIGEQILIDGGIRITITAIEGNRVRIGVTAPSDVRVDREEVHRRRVALDASLHCEMPPAEIAKNLVQT